MTDVCCGIDLGTSGVKVSLGDRSGRLLASATAVYPLATPSPGWAEIDPGLWWQAIAHALERVMHDVPDADVKAIGIDGQMHGIVLSAEGRAVRPAVLWPDSRAASMMGRWHALPVEIKASLANPIVPGMAGPILDWLAHYEPDALAAADAALSPKDWVRQQLTGGPPMTDRSDASATLLWDVTTADWHWALISALGLPSHLLPEVHSSTDATGVVTATAAQALGLPSGIAVAVGCADAAATLLAAQPEPGEALVIIGTGIQVIQPGITARADPRPRYHTFTAATGLPYAMVAPQNGGLALGRVADLLNASWEEFYASLDEPNMPDDLVFAPWFSSERLPAPKPAGHAGWSELGLASTRPQLMRSALESVAFQVRQAAESLPLPIRRARLAGGGTRSVAMQQLLTDVLDMPTRRCDTEDVTAVGAVMLAWACFDDQMPPSPVHVGPPRTPNPDRRLGTRYERFLQASDRIDDQNDPTRTPRPSSKEKHHVDVP